MPCLSSRQKRRKNFIGCWAFFRDPGVEHLAENVLQILVQCGNANQDMGPRRKQAKRPIHLPCTGDRKKSRLLERLSYKSLLART
jgi:hypothetical protein